MSARGEILIVEDTPDSLMILNDMLTFEGYQVCPTENGAQALAAVAAHPPDLILLDIMMEGMDGFEVCRRLKAQPDTCNIPIIFLTALTQPAQRIEGLRLGAVDFISKPFQREELLARVKTHVELGRLRTRLEHLVVARTRQLEQANEQLQSEIAERKEYADKLRLALAEKEILLKEVHHRVKNNLTVVVSLLALKAKLVADAEARQALIDSQQRVRSMAMVHEELYRSGDLSKVDMGRYLSRLAARVVETYNSHPGLDIQVDVSEGIWLSIEKAVPVGQIANELITNALKHAFLPGRPGKLWIKLSQEGEQMCFTVADDGVGLPEGVENAEGPTLGMQLVQVLTQQVAGSLEVRRQPGTTFVLWLTEA